MTYFLTYFLYIMSVVTFIIYGWDKHAATYGKSRVPEIILILLAIFAGGFGALCGMIIFNHKTQNNTFIVSVPIVTILQIAIIVLLRINGF